MLAASSRDTVRSQSRTGKPSRQLRSAWTDAWDAPQPGTLPMPLQIFVSDPSLRRAHAEANKGTPGPAKWPPTSSARASACSTA